MKRKIYYVFVLLLIFSFISVVSFITYRYKGAGQIRKAEVTVLPKDIAHTKVKASRSASYSVPILIYHYVEINKDKRDTIRQSLTINPTTFDEQIKTLVDAGFTFITASELADVMDGKRSLPVMPVLVTIDDGHWDLATDILPILRKYNVSVTAFIVPGFIGGSDYLSKDQMQDIVNSGLVEIGAHTVHHVGLANQRQQVVEDEVGQSKQVLEKEYHIPISTFAYPGGSFDQQAIDIVKRYGFRLAFSTISGTEQGQNNRFFLSRLHPGYRTGTSLIEYIQDPIVKYNYTTGYELFISHILKNQK